MTTARYEQLRAILLALLPDDHSMVGNMTLLEQFINATWEAGFKSVSEVDFRTTRDAMVNAGDAVKGKGRGGSTALATGANRPDFDLKAESVTPDMLLGQEVSKNLKTVKPKAG